ncbi:futalosine hydrolase [Pseudodesulfovibrio cashew]|uniref:Futalosine hydrolase n=1 Tax=Pseudodesulfovibrio cashew TaxID=2678688 RepID=A0A6I6JII4_9BACT|nr:futalosine hydrolase [Pseudodesulfovibrio cashew]QGY39987.1 futalosine hydrolase [Pseudodesulfovibrio cashew]
MIVFVTATAKEMRSAFGGSAPAVEQGETREFSFRGRSLLLAVSGVGLVNAALAAGRLLDLPRVEGMVNVGIAGAYDVEAFPLGTTAYAWREAWPEYGLLDEEGRVDPKAIGFPQGKAGKQLVWNRVKLQPVRDAGAMGLHLGELWNRASALSVGSVTGSADRAGWLKTAFSGDIENMEGFAFGYACQSTGVPFLEVRTISNMVGSRLDGDWDLKGALGSLEEAVETLFSGA